MAKTSSKAARDALAATDWRKIDVMTDEDIARQIASNPDAAPDMAPEVDVRAIRRAAGMAQAQFAAAYEFSIRTVQEWERGAKNPGGPARTLLRAIKADPEGSLTPSAASVSRARCVQLAVAHIRATRIRGIHTAELEMAGRAVAVEFSVNDALG